MTKNLKDFALTKEEYDKFKDVDVKSLEELENFDFVNGGDLDVDEYHDMVEALKTSQEQTDEKKEALKQLEAENIIKDTAENFLGKEFVDKYNVQKDNLWAFLRKYDANSDLVKNMSEDDKNKIYDIAEYLFNDFQKNLNLLNFIFPLNFSEHKLLYDVLYKKLEYNQDEVFQLEVLLEDYLDIYKTFKKDDVNVMIMSTTININHLVVLYHLFSKHKIKGIGNDYENFKSILRKIGERTKLYNAYTTIVERLSSQFMVWGGSLTVDENFGATDTETPSTEPTIEISEKSEPFLVNEVTGEKK